MINLAKPAERVHCQLHRNHISNAEKSLSRNPGSHLKERPLILKISCRSDFGHELDLPLPHFKNLTLILKTSCNDLGRELELPLLLLLPRFSEQQESWQVEFTAKFIAHRFQTLRRSQNQKKCTRKYNTSQLPPVPFRPDEISCGKERPRIVRKFSLTT